MIRPAIKRAVQPIIAHVKYKEHHYAVGVHRGNNAQQNPGELTQVMLKEQKYAWPDEIELLLHRKRPRVAEHGPDMREGEPVVADVKEGSQIVEPDAMRGHAAGDKMQPEVDEPEDVKRGEDAQGAAHVKVFQ